MFEQIVALDLLRGGIIEIKFVIIVMSLLITFSQYVLGGSVVRLTF